MVSGTVEPKRLTTPYEVRRIIETIVNDLEMYLEEYNFNGATFIIDNTWEGAITLFIASQIVNNYESEILFIPRLRASTPPIHLEKWASDKGIIFRIVNLKEVVGLLRTYLKSLMTPVKKVRLRDINHSLTTVIARSSADIKKHMLIGKYTYTQTTLGAYNVVEYKSVDYLPLTGILYSDLPRIAYVYRIERLLTSSKIDNLLKSILDDNKIPNVEMLDNLILTIKSSSGISSSDIANSLDLPTTTVERIRDMLFIGESFKSMTPLSP